MAYAVVLGVLFTSILVYGAPLSNKECDVRARTTAGWVCGARRYDAKGRAYASFTNVPYAQQPLGELRFKELQPAASWNYLYDATKLGPICPQYNSAYGPLMTNTHMSEACIHVNVFVPLHAFRNEHIQNRRRTKKGRIGLPIFVFIHGGGFVSGSGDPDFHGPEYLVAKDIIVITFNYRLSVFGFLSLNTPSMPGNNGLRDTVMLLQWVRSNAQYFGGNPNDVTIAGQSAGGVIAHLMVLSHAADGLYHRAILMSGVSYRSFYTASSNRAQEITNALLKKLQIDSTDPEEIHSQLNETPYKELMNATYEISAEYGPISFSPIVEEKFEGITTIVDKDPECLILEGRGKDIPLLLGFTNEEGKFFLEMFINQNTLTNEDPTLALSPDLKYKLSSEYALLFGKLTSDRYFKGKPTPGKYAKCFEDTAFKYPAIKLMQQRTNVGGAGTYLYQFAYNADFSTTKYVNDITYVGAAHTEDIPTIFKTNSLNDVKGYKNLTYNDLTMRKYMVQTVKNFITCNAPCCGGTRETWPAQSPNSSTKYANILGPRLTVYSNLTKKQEDMVRYFNLLYEYAENVC